jgi:hypothetical protein
MIGTNRKPLVVPTAEACRLLGIRPTKFWGLVKAKKIDMAEIGKRRMPTFASLEKLVNSESR